MKKLFAFLSNTFKRLFLYFDVLNRCQNQNLKHFIVEFLCYQFVAKKEILKTHVLNFNFFKYLLEISSSVWLIMAEKKFPNLSVSEHPPLETRLNKQKKPNCPLLWFIHNGQAFRASALASNANGFNLTLIDTKISCQIEL